VYHPEREMGVLQPSQQTFCLQHMTSACNFAVESTAHCSADIAWRKRLPWLSSRLLKSRIACRETNLQQHWQTNAAGLHSVVEYRLSSSFTVQNACQYFVCWKRSCCIGFTVDCKSTER